MHGVIQDEFNELSAPQPEVTTQSNPLFGPIDNETGEHFLDSTESDDKAGALLRNDPVGSAALGKAGHSFTPAPKVLVERSEFHVEMRNVHGLRFVKLPESRMRRSNPRPAHRARGPGHNRRWGASCNIRPSLGRKIQAGMKPVPAPLVPRIPV